MKEMIKEYGGALIAAMVALFLLTVFSGICINGKKGIAVNMGTILADHAVKQLTEMEGTGAFSQYQNMEGPSFGVKRESPVYAGKETDISEHLLVQDKEGNSIRYCVKSIRDMEGTEVFITRTEKSVSVSFEHPGIYQIYLKTEDESVKNQEAVLSFPVQPA